MKIEANVVETLEEAIRIKMKQQHALVEDAQFADGLAYSQDMAKVRKTADERYTLESALGILKAMSTEN